MYSGNHATKITLINDESKVLITGSGCIHTSYTRAYTYVLTAKHCLIGKNKEYKDILTKEMIKIELNSLLDKEDYLNVIGYFLHPDDDHDIAVILVEEKTKIAHREISVMESGDKGWFYGFPFPRPDGVSLEYTLIENNKSKKKHFEIRSEDNLRTYLKDAPQNCQGFSGSGVYFKLNGESYLTGIITNLADKAVTFDRLHCESIYTVNEFLKDMNLEELKNKEANIENKIKDKLDRYKGPMEISIKNLREPTKIERINESSANVYEKLIKMDYSDFENFLGRYYFPEKTPMESTSDLIEKDVGIRQLWELLSYINCNSTDWNFVKEEIANFYITYTGHEKQWINLIYSLDNYSLPIIVLQKGKKFIDSPYKRYFLDNLWVIDHFENISPEDDICIKCGNGKDYSFENLLKDFSHLSETGVFNGIEPQNNSLKDVGNIKVLCSKCIKQQAGEAKLIINNLTNGETLLSE
ncbi:ABC-three component system protein [Bacillus wiedmannii]|uniref:ABC-three component system protein n=1 Tax=Bacillus wiedmannii TaxID=1890302 RepID=UPI0015D488E7|nr:ABC-three component system protein [Bacillus wiedmannii]